MKKITLVGMSVLMLGVGTLSTGCFGKFALTRKVYEFNDSLGNNFVKTIVFYAFNIIPVYSVAGFVDVVILNLIEFWTGSNPLAMAPGQKEQHLVMGKDGNSYQITATQNRFDMVQLTGEKKGNTSALVFTPTTKTWSMEKSGISTKLVTIHEDLNKAEFFAPDGSVKMVDLASINVQGLVMR